MQSEGPYFITQERDAEIGANWSLINGPGIEDPKTTATQDYTEATVSVRIRNAAYAEGRKSVQIKTPCPSCGFTTLCVDDSGNLVCSFLECKNPTEIANKEGRKAAEKEFKELLEMVDEFRSSIWWNGGLKFVKDFEDSLDSWKKARGIE